jgi:hypothetical protein
VIFSHILNDKNTYKEVFYMSILIGHSSIDENGRARGGQAGDQNGKEVYTREWYKASWDVLLRCKDSAMTEKMAVACE